jgi:hypothetical protein
MFKKALTAFFAVATLVGLVVAASIALVFAWPGVAVLMIALWLDREPSHIRSSMFVWSIPLACVMVIIWIYVVSII